MRSVKIILPSLTMAVLLAGCAPPPPPERVVYAEPRPAPVYVEPGYRAPVYVPPSEEPVPVYGPPVYGNRSDLNVTVLRTGDDRREYRRPGYPGRPGYYGDRRPGEGGERGEGRRRMCGQPGQPACQR